MQVKMSSVTLPNQKLTGSPSTSKLIHEPFWISEPPSLSANDIESPTAFKPWLAKMIDLQQSSSEVLHHVSWPRPLNFQSIVKPITKNKIERWDRGNNKILQVQSTWHTIPLNCFPSIDSQFRNLCMRVYESIYLWECEKYLQSYGCIIYDIALVMTHITSNTVLYPQNWDNYYKGISYKQTKIQQFWRASKEKIHF